MTGPYLSTPEAARALGIPVSTLQAWARQGRITPTWQTPTNRYQWDLDDLRRQLNMPATANVVAVIVTSDHGVLVTRRHDGNPLWGFPAGKAEPGEAPADTAAREVKEETSLEVVTSHVIGERDHPATGRHMVYMSARPYHGTDVYVADPAELAAVEWVSLAEAETRMPDMFAPVREHLARTLGRADTN